MNLAIDPYDDDRSLLKELPGEVRERLDKLAEDLSGIHDDLSDGDFALVCHQNGRRFRKFACTDEGNTAMSVFYFMQHRAALPEMAQKIAADNLLRASLDYGLTPPQELVLVASEKDPHPVTNQVILRNSDMPVHLKQASAAQTQGDFEQALDYFQDNSFLHDPWEKRSMAKWLVENKGEGTVPISVRKYAGEHYAPDVDSAILVRQVLCDNSITGHEQDRMKVAAVGYQELSERRGEMEPVEFAKEMHKIDQWAGLDKVAAVPDAVYSTFSDVPKSKNPLVFDYGVYRLTRDQLIELAETTPHEIFQREFGPAFADSFKKNPVTIFKSLPMPQKILVAKMTSQQVQREHDD